MTETIAGSAPTRLSRYNPGEVIPGIGKIVSVRQTVGREILWVETFPPPPATPDTGKDAR